MKNKITKSLVNYKKEQPFHTAELLEKKRTKQVVELKADIKDDFSFKL